MDWNQTQYSQNSIWAVNKRNNTNDIHQQSTLFHSHQINRQQHWRHRGNIIEWCIEIEHNTHSTQSEGWRQKKQHKWHPSTTNSFSFSSNQQKTALDIQEQHQWVMRWNQTQHSLNSICGVITKETTHKWHPSTNHSSILIKSTDNNIGDTGATSLSEALKSNTTLTQLNLWCEHKKKQHANGINQQSLLFHSHKKTGNKIGETGRTSFSEALKSNTTLTKLNLWNEWNSAWSKGCERSLLPMVFIINGYWNTAISSKTIHLCVFACPISRIIMSTWMEWKDHWMLKCWMVWCDFKKKKTLKCATHFLPLALKPSSFFLLQHPNDV